jgi:hypothetical protein
MMVKNVSTFLRAASSFHGETMEEMLEWMHGLPGVQFPCPWYEILTLDTRMPVLNQVMFPKKSHELWKSLDDVPERALLIADSMLTGPDMLWLVKDETRELDQATWYHALCHKRMVVGVREGIPLLASPLSAFVP